MSRRAKWSVASILVVLVGGVIVLGAAKRGSKALEVRMEKIQRRDLVASVTASGRVQPRTKVDIASDVSGRIVRLAVKEGDMVKKGQFLLQIDPSTYEAEVQRQSAAAAAARADLARALANLQQSRSALDRSEAIRKSNPTLISDEQLEQLRTTVEVNQALYNAGQHQVDQAEAALRNARSNLAKTTIMAPMSGKVTRLNIEQGETAIQGTLNKEAALLLTISDMDALETKVKVDETDVARVAVGDSAIVQIDAFPDTTFLGRVVEISNSSVQTPGSGSMSNMNVDQAVDYEVKVQLLNPPRDTRPDFSATARIITDTRKDVLSIPIIALTVRERDTTPSGDSSQLALGTRPVKQVGKKDVEGVFVVGSDNKVAFRQVRTGITGEEYLEVLSGLEEGETIVSGSFQAIHDLKEGMQVRESRQAKPKKGVGA